MDRHSTFLPTPPMTFDLAAVAILAILFLSALTRSMMGFGEALVAMPLLALVVDVKMAVPLVALVSTTTTIGMILREWRGVQVRTTLLLVAAAYAGIPLGLFYLTHVDEHLVEAALAVVIIAFCVYRMARPRGLVLQSDRSGWLFGFFAGLLGGAYNTHGPPLVMFGTLRSWPPDRFRATLQGYFLLTCPVVLGGHYYEGLWTRQVFVYFLAAVPMALLSLYLGGKLHRRLDGQRFVHCVHAFLIAIGMVLLVTSLWSLVA